MAFSKSFPRSIKGSNYPEWVDVYLSEKEERFIEDQVRQQNIVLMKRCLDDARSISEENGSPTESISSIAVALFEKLASHSVHAKERRCKDKFDRSEREGNSE